MPGDKNDAAIMIYNVSKLYTLAYSVRMHRNGPYTVQVMTSSLLGLNLDTAHVFQYGLAIARVDLPQMDRVVAAQTHQTRLKHQHRRCTAWPQSTYVLIS